jgi:hypothetical protein
MLGPNPVHRLAKPFLFTSALACSKAAPPAVEVAPSPPSTAAPSTAVVSPIAPCASSPPAAPLTDPSSLRIEDYPKILNGEDAQGREVVRTESDKVACVIPGGPILRRPGRRAPPTDVPCPPGMETDGWKACIGGTVHATERGDACVCTHLGNPPPPLRRVPCP